MVCIVGAMNSGYIGILSVGSCEIRQFGGGCLHLRRGKLKRITLSKHRRGGVLKVWAHHGLGGSPRDVQSNFLSIVKEMKPRVQNFAVIVVRFWKQNFLAWHKILLLRVLATFGGVLLLHLTVNIWSLPRINKKLPSISKSLAKVVKREIIIERVNWLAPSGLLGVHPIANVGPVQIGPGPVEQSHGRVESLDIRFNPLRSIFSGRFYFSVKSQGASLHLKQADNFSWFGFPDDTYPSSRFVPPAGGGGPGKKAIEKRRKQYAKGIHTRQQDQIFKQLWNWHMMKSKRFEDSLLSWSSGRQGRIVLCTSDNKHSKVSQEVKRYRSNSKVSTTSATKSMATRGVTEIETRLNQNLVPLEVDLRKLYSVDGIKIGKNGGNSSAERDPSVEKDDLQKICDKSKEKKNSDKSKFTMSPQIMEKIKAINRLPPAHIDERSINVRSEHSFDLYNRFVNDPGTERKKTLGSKALQEARNWKPATARAHGNPTELQKETDDVKQATTAIRKKKEVMSDSNMQKKLEKTFHTTEKPKRTMSVISEPTYTPAPAEAFSERRSKSSFAKLVGENVMSFLVNRVALNSFENQGGTLHGYVYGDKYPRVFKNLRVKTKFGNGYNNLAVEVEANVEKRQKESFRNTMGPNAHRHLRDFIGSSEYSKLGEQEKDMNASGGDICISVTAENIVNADFENNSPSMRISINARDLHAPVIERLVELPMDINQGRLNGNLVIVAEDAPSWSFPKFHGRVAVRDSQFHFWDAPDDIIDANMDLIFEGDRVYLHKAKGYFGAVPMKVTGDLDLNPLHGEYRVSASVPGVEVNALRASLGIRPTPFAVSGAVAGTMHVSGPLEKPIFSGHAHVQRPTKQMLDSAESSPALDVLKTTKSAVGSYDRIPFREAGVVFSLNTATDTMTLHAIHGLLIDGGQLQGAGLMNVAPAAEMDPNALQIVIRGSDIHQDSLVKRLVPEITLPSELDHGISSGTVVMKGAHLSPIIDVNFLSSSKACGHVKFERDSTSLDLSSPHFDISGTAFLNPPSFEIAKSALTQAKASALAKPNFTGCNLKLKLNGLDVVPFLSDDDSVRSLSKNAGEPVKLRLNGHVKIEGDFNQLKHADVDESRENPWSFRGLVDLENIRLNQLMLYRDLRGVVEASDQRISAHGKGMRPDEVIDLEIDMPHLMSQINRKESVGSSASAYLDVGDRDSYMNARCGKLQASGSISEDGSAMDFRLANVKLDDLEFASLRGELQEISCAINFKTQTGRGRASIIGPKYSGILGDSLSGGFRWEKDVLRLEKIVLQQQQSRYEVQGEYVLPPSFNIPASTADLFDKNAIETLKSSSTGRWRLRLDAPHAQIQDITPLARVLQTVNDQFPEDYERAKGAFMNALSSASIRLNDLNDNLNVLMDQMSGLKSSSSMMVTESSSKHSESSLYFPALQTCQGFWNGSLQAFGGGGGATSMDFDIRGQNWLWGDAHLDSFIAKGSGHSEEGLQLQEFVLNSGDAKLLIRGSLLNDNQDASLLLTDFPVSTLQPIFQAIPALRNASPAVPARDPEPLASPLPLGMIASAINRISHSGQGELDGTSPINGLLFMSGTLTGSKNAPSGDVMMRVYDAAVGPTRLAKAQASAKLSAGTELGFDIDVIPLDGQRSSGCITASGTLPLSTVLDKEKKLQRNADEIDIRISVKDGGMAVLTSLTPNLRWKQGVADLSAHIHGKLKKPDFDGAFVVSKAIVDCPILKYPLNLVSVDVRCEGSVMTVKGVDARVGRKGRIRVRGALPLHHTSSDELLKKSRITLDLQGLELKSRNTYTGQLDALLTARDSTESPVIGGSVRFSRGSLYLNPQGQDASSQAPDTDQIADTVSNAFSSGSQSVGKVFKLLTEGDSDLAIQLEDAVRQEMEAMETIVEDTGGSNAVLDGLAIQFGPDLRAVYPPVMNFGISGELVASGPAHPETVSVSGCLKLPSGEINLLAAQFELDREHENTVLFGGNTSPLGSKTREKMYDVPVGIDPLVDIVLNSGDLKVTVTGKASEWADHLVMQSISRGNSGMEAGEQLDALEAARVLEAKLKSALLADNGQIALNKLAGSTMATFMPKIETQGSVGGTRWRLVSAPSVPGLLDPRDATAANMLDFLTLGAEVEVSFGEKLQAAMIRKLRESDVMTKWTLNYNLSSKLRMQFNISSAPPYPKTLTFQYSSEGD